DPHQPERSYTDRGPDAHRPGSRRVIPRGRRLLVRACRRRGELAVELLIQLVAHLPELQQLLPEGVVALDVRLQRGERGLQLLPAPRQLVPDPFELLRVVGELEALVAHPEVGRVAVE